MKSRTTYVCLAAVAWMLFGATIVWPTIALIARCITQGEPPDGGFTFSGRQLGLLWRSVWLSGLATGLCLLISLPGAFVVGRVRRLSRRPLIAGLFITTLLCPPTVYAFGWEQILPAAPFGLDAGSSLVRELYGAPRCILVWALWAWPIPAMLIGAGWSRAGRCAYESALMVTSTASAFVYGALPTIKHYVALAGLLLFVLFFSDYGVPHACLLQVYATELLGWAESSMHPIDTAWPALPPALVTGFVLVGILITWRRCAGDHDDHDAGDAAPAGSHGLTVLMLACFAVSWLLPVGSLFVRLASPGVIVRALKVYGADLTWSLGLAAFSGLLALGMGVGLLSIRRLRTFTVSWAVAFGALPGALIGASLVAAYNRDSMWWVYDFWPIVAVSYVSHFGWVGVLTALVVVETVPTSLIDQARTDGATTMTILGRIQIPMGWPGLLCGAGIVAALSVADIAASSLVRVPSFSPIAHVLMEKFHRFEDDMLVSLSLCLVAATVPAVMLLAIAMKRRG